MTTLIVDADYIAYRYAYANQTSIEWDEGAGAMTATNLGAAKREIIALVNRWCEMFQTDKVVMALGDPKANWRHAVLPEYKANRQKTERPKLWPVLREFIAEHWNGYIRPTLEGDDVCGILATSQRALPGPKIVVGIDKDLRTVPCWLFNPLKETKKIVSLQAADRLFYTQVLTGDPSDNYRGCPGIGEKRAEKLMAALGDVPVWDMIVNTYESKGLTEDDALQQARVARVCRASDYDFKKKEVILWQPTCAS